MAAWLSNLLRNWDAVLAFFLTWTVIAIYLGPVYYFVILAFMCCIYLFRLALRR